MNVVALKPSTLEEHLDECDARYKLLVKSIDKVENRLDNIEQVLLEIKQALNQK